MNKNEAPRSKLRDIRAKFLRSQPHFAKASLGVPLAPSSSKQALRYSAKGNKIALASLAMDLRRVALSWHRGSFAVANRFFEEALKRRGEINKNSLKPYLVRFLKDIDKLQNEQDNMKKAEDALMYSILFQNAALK